jgi:prepilin-type N-terminal cleavage/methylation domain-containing protein
MNINNSGFTLVEIAIVLVVVGLLTSVITKGHVMLVNAQLKRVESDAAGIRLAIATYQDRYWQLPGDDSRAFQRFDVYQSLNADDVDGDGSGTIEGLWDDHHTGTLTNTGAAESEKIFAHLRAAGLIPGGSFDTTRPLNANSGKIGVQDGALELSGLVTVFGHLDGYFIKIIESRLDDGKPNSGKVQAEDTMNLLSRNSSSLVSDYLDSRQYNVAFSL